MYGPVFVSCSNRTNGGVKISTLRLIIFNTAQILEFATFFPYKILKYEGWNFNSDNYLFTTDTK